MSTATKQAEEAEFAEIMGELEKLQKEVDSKDGAKPDLKIVASNPAPAEAAPAPTQIQDFHAGASSDAALEDTLSTFKDDQEENEDSLFAEKAVDPNSNDSDDSIVGGEIKTTPSSASTAEEGSLSMTISGAMRLELRYALSDQSVYVSFEDQMLRIEMNDGTEFKVPFHKKTK